MARIRHMSVARTARVSGERAVMRRLNKLARANQRHGCRLLVSTADMVAAVEYAAESLSYERR